jgi:hypothetical protein
MGNMQAASLEGAMKSALIHTVSGAAAAAAGCVTKAVLQDNGIVSFIAGCVGLISAQAGMRALVDDRHSMSTQEDAIGLLPGLASFLATMVYMKNNGFVQ